MVMWCVALVLLCAFVFGMCLVIIGGTMDGDCPEAIQLIGWGVALMVVSGVALGGAADKLL